MTCFRFKTGENLHKFCMRTGTNYWKMYKRCDGIGLTPEQAVSAKTLDFRRTKYHMDSGEPLIDLCRREHVPYSSVLKRVRVNKETPQNAFTTLVKRKKSLQMFKEMIAKAEKLDVYPTKFTRKIAAARVRMGLDISVCPCAKEDHDRGCISEKCLKEIKEKGICHCQAFRRKGFLG